MNGTPRIPLNRTSRMAHLDWVDLAGRRFFIFKVGEVKAVKELAIYPTYFTWDIEL